MAERSLTDGLISNVRRSFVREPVAAPVQPLQTEDVELECDDSTLSDGSVEVAAQALCDPDAAFSRFLLNSVDDDGAVHLETLDDSVGLFDIMK